MLENEPEKIPDTADLLLQLRELLDGARSMPLSASVMVNREELGEILQDAMDGLPEELRQARWLLEEREAARARAARRRCRSKPRTTSTASSPASRSCSTARCSRWPRAASGSPSMPP